MGRTKLKRATVKEQKLQSIDILCVVWRDVCVVSAQRIQEGFLEEMGAWECFEEGGGSLIDRSEIEKEAFHRQTQAD